MSYFNTQKRTILEKVKNKRFYYYFSTNQGGKM